jgi:hypothetical protein
MARRARGGDPAAARIVVPTPYEAAPPPEVGADDARHPAQGSEASTRNADPATVARPARGADPTVPARVTATAVSTRTPDPARDTRSPIETTVAPATVARSVSDHAGETRGGGPFARPSPAGPSSPDSPLRSASRSAAPALDGPTTSAVGDEAAAPEVANTDPAVATDDDPLLDPVAPRAAPPRGPRGARMTPSPSQHAGTHVDAVRPVVRVTIGRVDVRGVPAAATAPRAAPARHTPMPLDEYLRRRDTPGGGR